MTGLFVEFITDKRGLGHCKFKFNEKTVLVSDIEEFEKLFSIFLKHLRFAYESLNVNMNDRLSVVANEVNKEYPKFRNTIGYIKTERDKMVPYLEDEF